MPQTLLVLRKNKSMHNYTSSVILLLCLLLAACDMGSQRRLDRETLDQENRRREPRRIKEGEILEAALAEGKQLVELLEKSSTADSSSCCPMLSPSVVDSLENQYQAGINCYSLLTPLSLPDPLEQQLVEAYQYNLEQKQALETNVQAQGHQDIIFTAPATNGNTIKSPCAVWSIRLNRKQVVLGM